MSYSDLTTAPRRSRCLYRQRQGGGIGRGLGEATARHLASEGAIVVLGARRVDRIQSLAAELTGRGGKALAVATDVTQYDQVQRLVDSAVRAYGGIDVMINNAGLMPQSLIEHLKVDEWDQMIDVNIKGVLYGIDAALQCMKEQRGLHGTVEHHQRSGGRRAGQRALWGDRDSCRFVRAGGRLRHESAGGGRH